MAEEKSKAVMETDVDDVQVATAKLEEGKKLLDDDPEKAVEILCGVVRAFEKHYGDLAIERAPAYLYYGVALYEVARNSTDALGTTKTTVEPAARQKDEKEAAGASKEGSSRAHPAGNVGAGRDAEGAEQAVKAPPSAAEGAKPASADEGNDAAVDSRQDASVGDKAGVEEGKPAEAEDNDGGEEAAEGNEEEAGEEVGEEEGEGGGDADEGGDGGEEEQEEGGEGSGGSDMKLAWELVELARVIYSKNNPEQHHSMLAEVHKTLGDIRSEQEQFEEAVECYKQSVQHLEAMQPPSKRRMAEMLYKMSLTSTFLDQPEEAITQARAAIAVLETVVADEEQKLTVLATDGSGGEAVEEEGRRIQATIDDLRAVVSELQFNIEGLQDTIAQNNSLKEYLKSAYLKAASGLPGDADGAANSALDAPSNPAAAVQAIIAGVVGMGKKKLTIQPTGLASGQARQQLPSGPALATAPGAQVAGKRTLADLMGGAPVPGAEVASGFGALAVVEVGEGQQPLKKVRTEETPAAEPAAAASCPQEMETAAE